MRASLHTRLAAILLGLLLLVGGVTVVACTVLTRLYVEEATQQLHADLARNIAAMKQDLLLTPEGEPREEGLRELFSWLMAVNPSVEFYLLDVYGRIVAYDAPPELIVREQVDLGPIRAFLDGDQAWPLRGDDPRHADRRKIFSVAPIPVEGKTHGYLYAVLASDRYEGVTASLENSRNLRLALLMLASLVGLAALFGVLLFARVTRPLDQLVRRIDTFRADGDETLPGSPRDEVAKLEAAFAALAARVEAQVGQINEMVDMRRELIANVSHDLRTPLATLQGYLETLMLKGGSLTPADHERYLRIALRHGNHLRRLVDELFELSKLEKENATLETETFSLRELVDDNVQRFQLTAREKRIELSAEADVENAFVHADIGLVERVLENLLSNAVSFTPEGGRIDVTVREDDDGLEVAVTDTGPGIPEEDLQQIFERYYRGAKASGSGTGLGLAISRRILELHGSSIQVESRPGYGSTFSFRLPIAPSLAGTGPVNVFVTET